NWPSFHSGDSLENARDADELSILYDLFITDAALFECPSTDREVAESFDKSFEHKIVLNVSYTYIGNGPAGDERLSARWVVTDWWNEGGGANQRPGSRTPMSGTLPPSNHDSGVNALYGDGHVEWVSTERQLEKILGHPGGGGTHDIDSWAEESILCTGDGTIDDIPETR
ncbi:H-X9-DG-CTERM domain-containing protein, partial [Planctomycetota bacterium]